MNLRRSYESDPRLQKAHELFVEGKASLRVAAAATGLSKRTLQRWSSPQKHAWEAERLEHAAKTADVAAVATITGPDVAVAAMSQALPTPGTPDDSDDQDLETKLLAALSSEDTVKRFGAVLLQQRAFFDELMSDVRALLKDSKRRAALSGRPLPLGQLMVIIGLGEKVATQQRKAHGIPDITKLELIPKGDPSELSDTERADRIAALFDVARARRAAEVRHGQAAEETTPPTEKDDAN